jgi:hypothetical protein
MNLDLEQQIRDWLSAPGEFQRSVRRRLAAVRGDMAQRGDVFVAEFVAAVKAESGTCTGCLHFNEPMTASGKHQCRLCIDGSHYSAEPDDVFLSRFFSEQDTKKAG